MSHSVADKKKLLNRVKRITGQSVALETTLQGEPDCLAVLQQVAAIKGAANGLMKEVLENHLREHLGANDLTNEQRSHEVEQVIHILKSYLK
ncbi:metal/formaldehyde-sensitive transcriptional repressor [Thalassotalea piscium]|uniref:DNA-binding FrmR family transcriptional regulator n=1 Tax=Thalassotalea piscium TaxID=1230533 RepID=A0A7X0NEK3_9GAMM|nr:metal/formaldehyde-sensitive transcriptional repressor [Thalassotalea piscium]MBB6542004.1 DNA-binding FrmR family transcriptional regulator [Thalassotalea piscium]